MSTDPSLLTEEPLSVETESPVETIQGDLSVTSLYTAGVWRWANMGHADLIESVDIDRVFGATNAALAVMRLFRWGLPKLAEGLAQRHALIDQLVDESSPNVIIELAAGLSMRGWRVMSRNEQGRSSPSQYYELDLPHVIKYKLNQLGGVSCPSGLSWRSQNLKMLTKQDVVELLGTSTSPLIIAEGLVMYLSPEELDSLLQVVAEPLRDRSGQLIFDWVPTIEQPPPGIIGRALGALMRVFTGGETFQRDKRSRVTMRDTLLNYGAKSVQMIDTDQVASQRDLPFPNAKTQQLIYHVSF